MTLVVYSGKKLYADDVVLLDPDAYHFRKTKKACKIFHDHEIAIAMCGNLPWDRHRKRVIAGISTVIFHAEIGKGPDAFQEAFKDEKDLEEFRKISGMNEGATFLIATSHALYLLTNEGMSKMRQHHEYCYGSGATFFALCRKSGMSIEDSFKKVAEYSRTVGDLAQVVDVSLLTDIVTNVTKGMLKKDPKKYADVVAKILLSTDIKRKEERE